MDVNAQSTFDPKTDLRATFPLFSPMVMRNNQPIIEPGRLWCCGR
jgi:hypothetical protein